MTASLRIRGTRLTATLTALAAVATMTIGSTFALFSASESSATNSFTTGSVSVGLGSTSVTCDVAAIMPGDSSTNYSGGNNTLTPCTYNVKYTGSASAWLAVDVLVTNGTTALYTGSADGFQLKVATGSGTSMVSGTAYTLLNGSSSSVSSGVSASNLLVSTTPAVTNDAVQFSIDYLLPLLAPNALQNGNVTVKLTFHAVQSANQPIGSCVAGRQCNTITWS